MGVKIFFFGHRKICIGEKFTFYVYFEIKKSLGHISHFPLARSTFSSPPFLGVQSTTKNNAKFEIVHLVFFAIP